MKLQVIVRLKDVIQIFPANTVAQGELLRAHFKAEGLHAVVAPVYPDRDDFDDFNY